MISPQTCISAVTVLLLITGSVRAESPAWLLTRNAADAGSGLESTTEIVSLSDGNTQQQNVSPDFAQQRPWLSTSDGQCAAVMAGCAAASADRVLCQVMWMRAC